MDQILEQTIQNLQAYGLVPKFPEKKKQYFSSWVSLILFSMKGGYD